MNSAENAAFDPINGSDYAPSRSRISRWTTINGSNYIKYGSIDQEKKTHRSRVEMKWMKNVTSTDMLIMNPTVTDDMVPDLTVHIADMSVCFSNQLVCCELPI